MNDNQPTTPPSEYRCPGEKSPISRAVHLGRLAAFYPACRECPHREDTGSLSPRQVGQLNETARCRRRRPLFGAEGAAGVYLDDLAPADARQFAAAFGVMSHNAAKESHDGNERDGSEKPQVSHTHHSSLITHPSSPSPAARPSIVLAGDGRPISAELVASAAEGLRWSGCDVIDIGPATAPCMAFAIHHLGADGGAMVGNPGMAPHRVGMQFWTAEPRPLSAGHGLDELERIAGEKLARPTRRSGEMRRFQADGPYLAALAEHYHAMRPLGVAVHAASKPAIEYLKRLCSAVACRVVPIESPPSGESLPENAHFVVQIDGDGETCAVYDERARRVKPERVLGLLSGNICGVAELDMLIKTRAEAAASMMTRNAPLGFGPGARYWHSVGGVPLPDAVMTVTWLLKILSRGDEPLSGVLDLNIAGM